MPRGWVRNRTSCPPSWKVRDEGDQQHPIHARHLEDRVSVEDLVDVGDRLDGPLSPPTKDGCAGPTTSRQERSRGEAADPPPLMTSPSAQRECAVRAMDATAIEVQARLACIGASVPTYVESRPGVGYSFLPLHSFFFLRRFRLERTTCPQQATALGLPAIGSTAHGPDRGTSRSASGCSDSHPTTSRPTVTRSRLRSGSPTPSGASALLFRRRHTE